MKKQVENEKLTDEAFSRLITFSMLGLSLSVLCLVIMSLAWYFMGI